MLASAALVLTLTLAVPHSPGDIAAPPVTARVARGCVRAPAKTLGLAKTSAFAPWARNLSLPEAQSAAQTACMRCTVGPESPPECAWSGAEAATTSSTSPAVSPEPELGSPASPASHMPDCPLSVSDDAFADIDVATLLQGLMLQASPQSSLPQTARRLGLTDVTQLCLSGRLKNASSVAVDAVLRVKPQERGLFAVLGPPVAPRAFSKTAVQAVSASVIPSRLWYLAETVVAGAAPLQYTLMRVQLDSIERTQGVRWADDILGTKAAVWTMHRDQKGDDVVKLEGVDGPRAVTFLAAAVESFADMLPGLQMNVFKKAVTMATLTIPKGAGLTAPAVLHLAFLPRGIVVATSASAIVAHLKKSDVAPSARGASATVFGFARVTDSATWSRLFAPQKAPAFIKNASATWFFSPNPQGWRGSVEMTVERQTFGQ